MSKFADSLGTILNQWRIGLGSTASLLKTGSNGLALRNNADTAPLALISHRPKVELFGARNLTINDANTHLYYQGSTPITLTIPANLMTVGIEIEIAQLGSGIITITPESPLTINGGSAAILLAQNTAVVLNFYSTNSVTAFGGAPSGFVSKTDDNDSVIEIIDHYFQNTIAANTPIGALGLIGTVTGATLVAVTTPNPANPGVIAIDTGTTATNHGIFRSAPGAIRFGSALYRFKMIVRLPNLSDATQSYTVNLGFGDSAAGNTAIVDGCRFSYSQANANWFAITSSNSVSTGTNTNTGVAVTTNFTTLEVEINKAATEVKYWIDGVLVATHTNNIPVASGRETGINLQFQKTVGTTARQLQIDFTKLRIDTR